ncbi:Pkinase-domain-containing protein, partial [Meira miltonrushii]
RTRRTLGDYALGKTLGAGSMGKVKLGVKMGNGEKVAIKIIPRHTSLAAAQNPRPSHHSDGTEKHVAPPTASFLAKAAAKDHSKEVRTVREGSLQLLLHHPYVCGMREMIIHPNHYYMIFEYVNGGQMLDYIISHGRLRERAARKFARQIGSALEYCHRNSIVHRDLKIENILISKTGNIKIIDFGLSNLFSPHSQLNTFCGSLYFAAPELLNAKAYTGPEVDVWSFGIVLYVLVCGKVPFDDQSMPALHAKIKKGQVEYPAWLSGECKHILSRMLVTNPSMRATLPEILAHPWMVKGYDGAPNPHIQTRQPLRTQSLNPEVIKGMTGFEFGSPEDIEARLLEVLTSDAYQQALQAWEVKHGLTNGTSISSADMGGSTPLGRSTTRASVDSKSKSNSRRFSGIDFYRKKLGGSSLFGSKDDSATVNNGSNNSSSGGNSGNFANGREPLDPTRGFHPLISIYYLVQEKMERERLYGHSFFASSNISLNGTTPPMSARTAGSNASSTPTPVFDSLSGAPPSASPPTVSNHRRSLSMTMKSRASGNNAAASPNQTSPLPPTPLENEVVIASRTSRVASTSPDKRRSFHAGVTPIMALSPVENEVLENRAGSESVPATPQQNLTQPSTGSSLSRRFGSFIGRSPSTPTELDAKDKRRQVRMSTGGIGTGSLVTRRASVQVPGVSASGTAAAGLGQVDESQADERRAMEEDQSPSNVRNAEVRRAGTLLDSRRASYNPRSTPAASMSRASGNQYLQNNTADAVMSPKMSPTGVRRPSDDFPASPLDTAPQSSFDHNTATPNNKNGNRNTSVSNTNTPASDHFSSKPVFLKGLFSVQTTTTKPRALLHADLIRVLERIGLQYRDVKGGYECVHMPSLDFSAFNNANVASGHGNARITPQGELNESNPTFSEGGIEGGMIRSPRRKPSRMSKQSSGGSQNTRGMGNSSSQTANSMAMELAVRFEIYVVKVPLLLGVNGLQFRRISGNPWQYQQLARRVLQELKL